MFALTKADSMHAIASESLSKVYQSSLSKRNGITALEDFSITIQQGEIFGLLGPNGAGKTTFIKILLSLVHPTSGSASILGTPLPDVNIKRRIGYLPENHRFPGYLTGDQVLDFFGRLAGVPRREIRSRSKPLLDLVGMGQWSSTKVRKYSKGMMQRLGLAQALVNDPDVIFLDEPTDGVDPVGRKEIRDILTDLKRRGKTIFLNSHLLSEVELISDRVAILDKGKLLKIGTVDELTSQESEYTIGITGTLPEGFHLEADALLLKLKAHDGSLIADLKTTAAINQLIDLLRKHGVEITSITQKRNSLEDSFISLLKGEKSQ